MTRDAEATCRFCGKPVSGGNDAGCAYCLLQLGLGSGGSSSRVDSESRSTFSGGLVSAVERFIKQGVLPQFGDYELESEIARGGMGVVYRARQRSLNRTVAVKMILGGQLASPESIRRFRLEAEAAARLHHPAIVPIYEIGEFETQHFFSMKLIEGVSLAECIRDFRLTEKSGTTAKHEQEICIAELMARVARAIEFAHQRGVLHRDLKPSNILIDEQGQPHLTDFGLAKLTGNDDGGLTLSAAILGTPGYLAPEQAAGRLDLVTTSADVYGLGATLYELLTGRPPFAGATAWETMRSAIEQSPTRPRQLNPAVHRDIETIALRCLEKAPERRYPSAAAVADELERFIRNEPIVARPVSRVEQAWRWCRRNPRFSILGGTLLFTIIVGSGVAFWQWQRAQSANVTLTENVAHLEWGAIDAMLEQGESSSALAKTAALLRENPNDWKAAMFAMSVMENRRFPVPAAPLIRHPDGNELTVARLSPDGRRIVTASYDGTARLWDASTSEPAAPPLVHAGPVTWAEFNSDGSLLATCSDDKTVRLWEAASGRPVGAPCLHDERVVKIQFSSDGRYLLSRTPQSVSILDGKNGLVLLGPLRHEGKIAAARFIDEEKAFFTSQLNGEESRLRVWKLPSGEEQAGLKVGPFRDADVSDDLTRAVVVDARGRGWISDFPSGKNRKEFIGVDGILVNAAFGTGNDQIAGIGLSHYARVWDARTARPISPPLPHYYLLEGTAFLNAGRHLLSWADDSRAQIWNVATGRSYCEPMRHQHRVVHAEYDRRATDEVCLTTVSHLKSRSSDTKTGAAQLWRIVDGRNPLDRSFGADDPGAHDACKISPDGRLVAVAKTTSEVWIYDRATGAVVSGPLRVAGGAWGIMFSPDGSRLITTTSRGQVSLWSIPEGKLATERVVFPTTIQPAEISPDGKRFATGSTDMMVRVWDATTGRPLWEKRHGSEINALAFSSDGLQLASAGEDRVVRLWDTSTGELVREFVGHGNEVMTVFFSPDGRRLLTGSLDFTGRIWDTATGKELAILPHQGDVIDTAYSPTGRYVATASRDRTAMIWDAETGLPHSRGLRHEQGVRNLRFSADGERLLTLDFRGLRVWDVETCHPLTVHLEQFINGGTGFQGTSTRFAVSPDGRSAVVSMDSFQAKMWNFSTPSRKAPAWFPELLEAVAGQRFAAGADRAESVPSESFINLERRLKDSTETDSYTTWARRWLFGARPSER
ncbi:MAG: protein kinase [Planctomycetia bacterium]|nr:protein kinase [Planctomycetia bacterium]